MALRDLFEVIELPEMSPERSESPLVKNYCTSVYSGPLMFHVPSPGLGDITTHFILGYGNQKARS